MADEDDVDEEFLKKFNVLFHKASAEREARFEKKLAKTIDTALGGKMDELRQILLDNDDDDDNDDKKPPGGDQKPTGDKQLSPEVEARLNQLDKDNKEWKAKYEKAEKAREEERQRSLRTEERNVLTQSLTGRVKGPLLDMVVENLHKNVVRDQESNKILWKNEEGDLLPLKDGLDAWSKTDYAKEVAPPVNTRGSGGRGGDGNKNSGGGALTLEGLGDILTGGRS